jgi:hypothetical protein
LAYFDVFSGNKVTADIMAEKFGKKPKLINDFFNKRPQKPSQDPLSEFECSICQKTFFGLLTDFCEKGHGLCPHCTESLNGNP